MWMCACCSRKAFGIWEPSPAEMLLSALMVRLCLLLSKASSEPSLAPLFCPWGWRKKKFSGDAVASVLLCLRAAAFP